MVTAELAACLPVLVLVLAVALSAVSALGARVRLQDAARELARSAARGDPASGQRFAAQDAPGAVATVTSGGGAVVAVVRLRVRPLGGLLPSFVVSERAVAAAEPTGDAS